MHPTTRVAVSGTDGTGKTTIVRRLSERYRDRPGLLKAFRAPQYHEDPDLPFGRLSGAIDALSVLGDTLGDPLLKTAALFLSMTLYGDVERHLESSYRPGWLVAERQCLADSLTYARFYLPYLRAPLDAGALEPAIAAAIAPDAWAEVLAWLPVFQARAGTGSSSFWELPLYVRDVFTAEPRVLLERLTALYNARVPDTLVILSVTPETLATRLAAKRGEGGPPAELHERAQVLAMFQAGLIESGRMLQNVKPDMTLHVLDTSEQTPEITERELLKLIGAENAGP